MRHASSEPFSSNCRQLDELVAVGAGEIGPGTLDYRAQRDEPHRSRRQLDLIAAQDLAALDVRIVVNRFEKGLFKTIKPADVRQALGRDVAYTIANDHAVMCAAVEQWVPIGAIRRRSPLGKDIELPDAGIAAALRLVR